MMLIKRSAPLRGECDTCDETARFFQSVLRCLDGEFDLAKLLGTQSCLLAWRRLVTLVLKFCGFSFTWIVEAALPHVWPLCGIRRLRTLILKTIVLKPSLLKTLLLEAG